MSAVASLGAALSRLAERHRRGDATLDVVAQDMSDALLSRCLWPESAYALERFSAALPRATVLQILWWMHEVYQCGGPHALALHTANRLALADAEGVAALSTIQSYLARVHQYNMLRSPLEAEHAAAMMSDIHDSDVAWW